jgi:hypothetical protein
VETLIPTEISSLEAVAVEDVPVAAVRLCKAATVEMLVQLPKTAPTGMPSKSHPNPHPNHLQHRRANPNHQVEENRHLLTSLFVGSAVMQERLLVLD